MLGAGRRRRPDQRFDPPGTPVSPSTAAGILRARLILIWGSLTNSGLFAYSPSPGPGNLTASITEATSDPYSNVTQGGVTSYQIGVPAIYSSSPAARFTSRA